MKLFKVFVLVMMIGLAQMVFAQAETDNPVIKIEDLQESGVFKADWLVKYVGVYGSSGTMNRTPIKVLTLPKDKAKVTVGYESDEKTPIWLMVETEKAKNLFFDSWADGSVDRMIINDSDNPASIKSGFNQLNTFCKMEDLASEASFMFSFKPEDVHIYQFSLYKSAANELSVLNSTFGLIWSISSG